MDRAELADWVAAYERAWRAPGTEALAELFAAGARYRMGPYEPTAAGLEAIAELWEREREGPDEAFGMSAEIVAVEGDTGVVRVEVRYGESGNEFRDLWLVRFDDEGRCVEFEEWAFAPGRKVG